MFNYEDQQIIARRVVWQYLQVTCGLLCQEHFHIQTIVATIYGMKGTVEILDKHVFSNSDPLLRLD